MAKHTLNRNNGDVPHADNAQETSPEVFSSDFFDAFEQGESNAPHTSASFAYDSSVAGADSFASSEMNAFGEDVESAANTAASAAANDTPLDTPPDTSPDTPPQRKKKRHLVLKVLLGLVAACVIAVVAVCAVWLQDMPDCSTAEDFNRSHDTEVYANDRTTLLARFQMEYRIPLESLDNVADYVEQGAIAVEDQRFYSHNGVDPLSIIRAIAGNIAGNGFSGASTITQQLVRNTVLADEMTDMTIKRKVREAYAAFKMEELFTKDEILLLYLNTINYGQGAYGIEAASQRYFSKSASELTLAEAALLAGIPQSPVYNNPIDFPDHALDRRNVVLDRMVECGYITQEQANEAKNQPIELNVSWNSQQGLEAYPYFASYVRQQLYESYDLTTAEIFQGGLTVYTTLDPEIQEYAEAAAEEKESQVTDELSVALVAIDPDTGYIKAMVGGKDYDENQYNLATQGVRQAGSSFKTFTLVAALEQGISPQTTVRCTSKVKIGDWSVENIYSINYGDRSIARAFAVSSNTGFARLISAIGPETVVETAKRMGITSELSAVPALTLGVCSVSPLEMASAYATIASGGIYYEPVCITEAYDYKGTLVIDNTNPQGTRVISENVASAAIEVMRLVVESYEGTGRDAALSSGQVVAGKTGTSENYMDSWFCGITPQLSVALWMGDPSNVVSIPSNISVCSAFATFMNAYMEGRETEDFPTADPPTYTKTFKNADLDITNITSSSSTVTTRDTTGLTAEEARQLLNGKNVVYQEVYSDTVPAGTVISQSTDGSTITVVISKGPAPTSTDPVTPDPVTPDPVTPDPEPDTPDPDPVTPDPEPDTPDPDPVTPDPEPSAPESTTS